MKYTVEHLPAFQILGVSRKFHAKTAFKAIPEFWDEYYRQGNGKIACGQFAYCFDEQPDGTFRYAIGNRCDVENGVCHIFNRPDRDAVPDGFELLTVPSKTWLKVECLGPLPQSIQGKHPVISREWPAEWERDCCCEIEEYGYCETPEDAQKADYQCFIWLPVRKKCEIVSLREHPEMLEKFVAYFASHWGHGEVYRDCMVSALTGTSPLPQWFMALTPDGKLTGGAGLITNDFNSRMDLWPWLCALYVEEDCRCQGLGGRLIGFAAETAKGLGYGNIYCCTDHTGYYERSGFEYIGTAYHPWNETSRIYRKTL